MKSFEYILHWDIQNLWEKWKVLKKKHRLRKRKTFESKNHFSERCQIQEVFTLKTSTLQQLLIINYKYYKENLLSQKFFWVLQSSRHFQVETHNTSTTLNETFWMYFILNARHFQIENINTAATVNWKFWMHFRFRRSTFLGKMKNVKK